MLTVIVAIIVFGLLIGVHEAGHLAAAKANGIKVHEFAIGMGPKLFSFSTSETMYSLRLIPIGGYCKMEGEDEESSDDAAFCNKSAWRKFTVIVAGALMNLVLGFVALCILFAPQPQLATTTVEAVMTDAPAYEQGLKPGDRIISVNGSRTNIDSDISFAISKNKPGDVIPVTVKRGEHKINLEITAYSQDGRTLLGFTKKIENNSVFATLERAFYSEIFIMKVVIVTFADLFTGALSVSDASGPVGIVTEIGKAAKQGFLDVIYLVALISINLGLFNLIPFPALDGGRAVFAIFEMIFKRKVPAKVEAGIHAAGMLLLFALMIFVTFNDILKAF